MNIDNTNVKQFDEQLVIINKMNSYYKNLTYYNKYNFDIWMSFIVICIVLYVVIYYFIQNNLHMVKNDWDKYKCNPLYMPFAHIIHSENSEFTKNNLNDCLNKSNFKLGIKISKPFDIIFYIFKIIFSVFAKIILMIIRFIVYLLMTIVKIFRSVLERILKIFDELNFMFIRLADMVNHILSIFTFIYYICVKVINLVRFVFFIIQLAFFAMVILPITITFGILSMLLIIQLILAWFFGWINPFFWVLVAIQTILLLVCGITLITVYIISQNTKSAERKMGTVSAGFQNLNDIENTYENKQTILKKKVKYILNDTKEKILAGNFKDIKLNTDELFFKDNKVLPKCCEYNPSYSTDKGCVCSTLEQEEYLKRNGLNKSYNNNNNQDDDEKNININNLFFSPTQAFKGEENVFNNVTNKDKNKYINKNDVFHSDLSKNIIYSKLYLQSR